MKKFTVLFLLAAFLPSMAALAQQKQEDAKPLRGQPLQGAPLTPQETVGDDEGPLELDDDDFNQYGEPIRNIPQSSFDLLESQGGPLGLYSDELKFEKTKDGKYFKVSFVFVANPDRQGGPPKPIAADGPVARAF